ncbi:unnamed protein product [Larinioides sclopetarius]|uniref:BPTI/Kunitz inhibitor domain-containing protein n=1 Tax=Larinioides sclopetarius TaxID=280406 RepID=A0AAV2BTZ1_9ARAC
MMLVVVLALVAGAFALQDCSVNSHYESCGTACPLTCDNYKNPPKVCVLMCNPGCHCDAGYVKAEDGSCVMPETCPSRAPEVCGENERYSGCGTACPLTCDNFDNPPKICPAMCRIGCECKKGYIRSPDGRCVTPEDCPNRSSIEKNCEDKPDRGMCLAYFPAYYYDKETNTCKKFIYGGCQGNGNRYRTEEECLENCAKSSSVSTCDQPKTTGPCRALFHRYFFNQETGLCEKFIYGGCGGNQNNFVSQKACEAACMV